MAIKVGGTTVIDDTRNITNIAAIAAVSLNITGNGSITFPSGTTEQRPQNPTSGMLRYNTSTSSFEGYANGEWSEVGSGSGLGNALLSALVLGAPDGGEESPWQDLGTSLLYTGPITAGSIQSTPIGSTTASSGAFTTLTASTSVTLSPSGAVTVNPTTAGTINNMSIGATTRASGAFTTLTANAATTLTAGTASTTTTTGTLVVTGGVGISGAVFIGSTLDAASLQNTPIGTVTRASGAFTTLTANAATTLTAGTASSSTTTGTLVVTGGVGVSGNLYIGGSVVSATASFTPTNTYDLMTKTFTELKYGKPWTTVTGATTATAGDRFFVNTSAGGFTITLPLSPTVGDTIQFVDVAGSFATGQLTIGNNGNRIMRQLDTMVVTTPGAALTLVWSGNTSYGWVLDNN